MKVEQYIVYMLQLIILTVLNFLKATFNSALALSLLKVAESLFQLWVSFLL